MALTKKLAVTDEFNEYGIDFAEAYFKIDNARVDLAREEVRVEVRGYADSAARELQKTRDALKIEMREQLKLAYSGEKTELTIVEMDKILSDASKGVIGIYKEVFTISLSELGLTNLNAESSLSIVDQIKTVVYNYLKTNIEYFSDVTDVLEADQTGLI